MCTAWPTHSSAKKFIVDISKKPRLELSDGETQQVARERERDLGELGERVDLAVDEWLIVHMRSHW